MSNSFSNHRNSSYNLTGDLTYVRTIDQLQAKPDIWLYLLQHKLSKLQNGPDKEKILKYFFLQAQKILDVEQNKYNESFAKILVHEALHVGNNDISDARDLFESISLKFRRLPFVHLAFAQFELDQGRKMKAMKILRYGINLVSNHDVLHAAVTKLNNGEANIMSVLSHQRHSPPRSTSSASIHNHSHNTSSSSRSSSSRKLTSNSSSNFQLKSPFVYSHRMTEALDLPSSPCTPELNSKIRPGLKTPLKKMRSHGVTLNLSTPKTPVFLNLSPTKSHSCQIKPTPDSFHQPVKTKKESTKSGYDIGLPSRVLRTKQENDQSSDEETDLKKEKGPPLIQRTESPLLKENVGPRPKVKKIHNMSPPSSVPSRTPRPSYSGDSVEDSHLGVYLLNSNNRVIKVHGKVYNLMKELGSGGSSKVFMVFDSGTKSNKALKVVTLKGCDNTVREGFINEIKFLQRLKGNWNIIELYDYELSRDHLYMVMECGSRDLAKYIHERRKGGLSLEPREIDYIWWRMLNAIKTIHDQGVIHLDLKPANFLFVNGSIKLIDFGIAKSIQSDATSIIKDTLTGTLNYMAPEAIMDMSGGFHSSTPKYKISPRADVWSLGCILYFMMYNRTPFQLVTNHILKLNAITNPACKIEFEYYSNEQLLMIVQSCLQRDPKKRPTVDQLLRC